MKTRMSDAIASDIAHTNGFPLGKDYHKLRTSEVEGVLNAAHTWGYKKPKNYPGSKARAFYAFLNRARAVNQLTL